MTELAYMVREDWAHHGTAMVPQSAVIREWIGEAPYLFALTDVKKFNRDDRSADLETADYIAPDPTSRKVFNISELAGLAGDGKKLDHAIVVLHPKDARDLEALASAVENESSNRVFVMIWSPRDLVRVWLDGSGATDLNTGQLLDVPDPLLIAAAKSMVDEEYNGLSSGRGKDAVVQLVRAFAAEGYPLEVDIWLRAYFAAGGTFRHAESIANLIGEIKEGTKHRVSKRYVDNIVEVLRDRVSAKA